MHGQAFMNINEGGSLCDTLVELFGNTFKNPAVPFDSVDETPQNSIEQRNIVFNLQ